VEGASKSRQSVIFKLIYPQTTQKRSPGVLRSSPAGDKVNTVSMLLRKLGFCVVLQMIVGGY
jgi:hypothetical protein